MTDSSAALEVRLLGLVDFDSAVQLQERMVYELSGRRDRQGALLLCEHPPAISIGREGSRTQLLVEDEDLEAWRMPLRWVSRSGGAVVHAPGQLAIYPLLPLHRLGVGLAEYRRRLEQVLLGVCHELRAPAKLIAGNDGVWGRNGQVGAFGGAVRSWVTLHGMWLNVAPDPSWLRLARSDAVRRLEWTVSPGGTRAEVAPVSRPEIAAEERVTSLQEHLRRRVSMATAREAALRLVAASFGYESVHVYTGHPALTLRREQVCLEAS